MRRFNIKEFNTKGIITTIVTIALLLTTSSAVVLLPTPSPSFADNTTVTVVVASPNDVNANLGVSTPGNANINVGINAGGANVNLSGVSGSQVNIGGANVAKSQNDLGAAVSMSLAGVQFNQENYNLWVLPLRKRLDATLEQLAINQQNLDLTMAGTAKAIIMLQDQEQRLNQLTNNTSFSNIEKQKFTIALNSQFENIEAQLLSATVRDTQIAMLTDDRIVQLSREISILADAVNTSNARAQSLEAALLQSQSRIQALEADQGKSVWDRILDIPVMSSLIRVVTR